jgi:hypothetical protein
VVAYQALRHLIRSSGTPELSTNNTLQSLLDGDRAIAGAFLETLSRLGDRDVRGCRIERESYGTDSLTGKQSYFDFRLSQQGRHIAVIETKVDSALTSGDQARRCLEAVAEDGLLMFVTREPLLASLAEQVQHQLEVPLTHRDGMWQGIVGGKAVLLLAWKRLLHEVTDDAGETFEELTALAAAVEGVTDFVPFTDTVRDTEVGRTVAQVVKVARQLCDRLSQRLADAGVQHKISTRRDRGDEVYVVVTILDHEFWVGYDADYWALIPGDQRHRLVAGAPSSAPSPFWINCAFPVRAGDALTEQRRQRLDRLGIAVALQVPLDVAEGAVVDRLLDQAVSHIRRVRDDLTADLQPGARDAAAQEVPGFRDS